MGRMNFLRKILVLLFTFLVFAIIYAISGHPFTFQVPFLEKFITVSLSGKKEILTYMGIMLMITLVYLELLMIRDHLWVLEGGFKEMARWRDAFFNKQSLQRQKVRKIVAVILSTVVFTWVYTLTRESELYSFLGVVLMVTVLYFEILGLRDDLHTISENFKVLEIEASLRRELKDRGDEPGKKDEIETLAPKEE